MVNQAGTDATAYATPYVTPYVTARDEGGAQIIADPSDPSQGPGPAIMEAKALTGDGVVNAAGEDLGKIEAIMLDVASGRVAYAVLSFGGFLGMGSKLFAIPWSSLKLDSRNSRFVFDVSKEKLQNAEGFDKDDWPSMSDPAWAERVHSYYDRKPYWSPEYVNRAPRRASLSTRDTLDKLDTLAND